MERSEFTPGPYQVGDDALPARFWSKVSVEVVMGARDPCWLWTAKRYKGYGRFRVHNTGHHGILNAHRVAYSALAGPIAEGMTIEHRCHTDDWACWAGELCIHRRCVNPAHLEVLSTEENSSRGHSKPTVIPEACGAGHSLLGSELGIRRDGRWRCKACDRLYAREAYHRDALKRAAA